jgi:hypothetical protein
LSIAEIADQSISASTLRKAFSSGNPPIFNGGITR